MALSELVTRQSWPRDGMEHYGNRRRSLFLRGAAFARRSSLARDTIKDSIIIRTGTIIIIIRPRRRRRRRPRRQSFCLLVAGVASRDALGCRKIFANSAAAAAATVLTLCAAASAAGRFVRYRCARSTFTGFVGRAAARARNEPSEKSIRTRTHTFCLILCDAARASRFALTFALFASSRPALAAHVARSI